MSQRILNAYICVGGALANLFFDERKCCSMAYFLTGVLAGVVVCGLLYMIFRGGDDAK